MNNEQKYNASAQQTVEYEKEQKGKTVKVALVIGGLSDAALLACAAAFEGQNTQLDEDSFEFETRNESALEDLFRAVVVGTVNLKLRDGGEIGALPDFHDKFLSRFYNDALTVTNHLLSVERIDAKEAPNESADAAFFVDEDDTVTRRFKAPFNGQMIEVAHELQAPNAGQSKRFRELTKNNTWRKTDSGKLGLVIKTKEKKLQELLRLYDEVKISVSGYEGEPPIHHKLIAVRNHFAANAEIVEKN